MRDLAALFIHIIANIARLLGPGGSRAVVAESILVKRQVLILNRAHQRAPNLRASDRIVAALCALLIRPTRLARSAIVIKPSTLLNSTWLSSSANTAYCFRPGRGRSAMSATAEMFRVF
jgi:putative transposase